MASSIYQSTIIFNLNDRLFQNALAGITEDQAKQRVSDHNNPVNWIAAHTVYARYLMLVFLGKPVPNPYHELFDNFKGYDASIKYPPLEETKNEWHKVTALLNEAMKSVTDEFLAGDSPIKSPIGDFTNGGTLAFLTQHESYDIGQLGFLKKYFTKEAMSYN